MLNEITLLALSKFDDSKLVRAQVNPGEYEIDELIRLHGVMKVGEDHPARIATAVPWQRIAAVLFSKLNGITVEAVLREALEGDLDDEKWTAKAQAAIEILLGSKIQTRKGRVSVANIHVQAVEKD